MPVLTASRVDRQNVGPELDGFFAQLEPARLAHVDELTEQTLAHGNSYFRTQVPEGLMKRSPVLLDDEDLSNLFANIIHQRLTTGRRPTLILGCNVSDNPTDDEQLTKNMNAIQKFGAACTDLALPFSYHITQYQPRTPIGRIRSDGHAVDMRYYQGQCARYRKTAKDILMVSGDADLRYMQATYLAEMNNQHRRFPHASGWVGGPATIHNRLPASFPRMNRLLEWYDQGNLMFPGIVPTHYGVTAGAYAAVEGFQDDWSMGEISRLQNELLTMFGRELIWGQVSSRVVVSCRQLVRNMVEGDELEYQALHTPSAGQRPSYRRGSLPQEDISVPRFQELLAGRAEVILKRLFWQQLGRAATENISGDEIISTARNVVIKTAAAFIAKIGDVDGTREVVVQTVANLLNSGR